MQLLPATAEEQAEILGLDWRGPDSLFDPFLNVKLGVAYLKTLYVRFGSVSTALAAYNWGPGRIDRRLRKGQERPQDLRGEGHERLRHVDPAFLRARSSALSQELRREAVHLGHRLLVGTPIAVHQDREDRDLLAPLLAVELRKSR